MDDDSGGQHQYVVVPMQVGTGEASARKHLIRVIKHLLNACGGTATATHAELMDIDAKWDVHTDDVDDATMKLTLVEHQVEHASIEVIDIQGSPLAAQVVQARGAAPMN